MENKNNREVYLCGYNPSWNGVLQYLRGVNGVQMDASRGYVLHGAGSVTGIGSNYTVDLISNDVTVTSAARINGVQSLALDLVEDSTGIDYDYNTVESGVFTFVAGDILQCHISQFYLISPAQLSKALVSVEVEYD